MKKFLRSCIEIPFTVLDRLLALISFPIILCIFYIIAFTEWLYDASDEDKNLTDSYIEEIKADIRKLIPFI